MKDNIKSKMRKLMEDVIDEIHNEKHEPEEVMFLKDIYKSEGNTYNISKTILGLSNPDFMAYIELIKNDDNLSLVRIHYGDWSVFDIVIDEESREIIFKENSVKKIRISRISSPICKDNMYTATLCRDKECKDIFETISDKACIEIGAIPDMGGCGMLPGLRIVSTYIGLRENYGTLYVKGVIESLEFERDK